MLASTGLHLWLLWPIALHLPTPKPQPVINAKLLEPNAKQPELQPLTDNSTKPRPPSPPKPKNTNPAPKKQHHPAAKASTLDKQASTPTTSALPSLTPHSIEDAPGLSMSQDELAIDPFERSFQQQILAHMRNKIRAPNNLHGSVRLEIQYSYRQVITQVRIIRSSNDEELDDWAIKAILSANPYPSVPKDLPENYIFRPTLQVAK
jgi:TonB family protein